MYRRILCAATRGKRAPLIRRLTRRQPLLDQRKQLIIVLKTRNYAARGSAQQIFSPFLEQRPRSFARVDCNFYLPEMSDDRRSTICSTLPCHVKDAPCHSGIKLISDFVNVIVGQHDAIFGVVEELQECEPEDPARDDHVVFLHSLVQKLGHPGIWPLFLGDKLRADGRRPAQDNYYCETPGCYGGASSYPNTPRKPIDALCH
jgi:hypothetical protein